MTYRIGKHSSNDIVIQDKSCADYHAEVRHERGCWMLIPNGKMPVAVNGKQVLDAYTLSKSDRISIGRSTIYWSDYLFEGEQQELHLSDLFSFRGRLSKPNFIAITLLLAGLCICVYFLPGLISAITGKNISSEKLTGHIQAIAPPIYWASYTFLLILFLSLVVKRMRDTGKSLLHLLIPGYNIYLLFVKGSWKPKV